MSAASPLDDLGLSPAALHAELERLKARKRSRDFATLANFYAQAQSYELAAADRPADRAPAAPARLTPPISQKTKATGAAPAREVVTEPRRPSEGPAIATPAAPGVRGAIAPAATRSVMDDELRRCAGKGGGPELKVALAGSRRPAPAASSPPRSTIAVKAGLAGGSQAAVVKLVSFGAGRARAQALMDYQTEKGELAAEREDGSTFRSRADVAALAAEWGAESAGREPSKDSLAFSLAFEGPIEQQAVRDAFKEALHGHAFAWRAETKGRDTTLHVVAVAAGADRDDYGRKERIFDNKKSLDKLHERLEDAFDREATFKLKNWAHGVEGTTRQLAALTKAGAIAAETSTGRELHDDARRLYERRGGKSAPPTDLNANLEIAKSWRRQMRSSEPRDFAHIVFSAKPGTDKETFLDAARATLAKEFAGHEYLFVLHTNREHIHVHAAVRMENAYGERLHPNIGDFRRWRETLAEMARERQIPMEATSRFDEAHAPGYKLKDIKQLERGVAPENVRRRVEAVRTGAIHRPTRDEGRAHARLSIAEWGLTPQRAVAAAGPPIAPGATRLYRAEASAGAPHASVLFTSDRSAAERLAHQSGASVSYLDVPRDKLAALKPARKNADTTFAIPATIAKERKAFEAPRQDYNARLLRYTERAAIAAEFFKEGGKEMPRTAETMSNALNDMRKRLDNAALLVDADKKEAFEKHRTAIIESAISAIDAQKKLEAKPVEMAGDRYVAPAPVETQAAHITYERRGAEVHYSRHDDTGQRVALAFVDKGKQLDVSDWTHKETVLAALRVSASKWETISITGNEKYKETVVQLAAEHGFKITNPELQDRIEKARAAIEAQRPTMREGVKEQEPAKEAKPAEAPVKAAEAIAAAAETQAKTRKAKETEPAEAEAQGKTKKAKDADTESQEEAPAKRQRASRKKTDEAANADDAPKRAEAENGPTRTDAERAVALHQVRAGLDREAKHETAEAKESAKSSAPSVREQSEAVAARKADRSADENPKREIPPSLDETHRVRDLRAEQSKVLQEEQQAKQAQQDKQNLERERQREAERQTQKPRHRE